MASMSVVHLILSMLYNTPIYFIQISMNVKLIMEDVHKHAVILMDLISVPVRMDMN